MAINDKLADAVAKVLGSWRFIGILSAITAIWILLNIYLPKSRRFDPYPFIALNLTYSFLAGYSAPILLISAARQSELDRRRAIENLDLERMDNKHLHEILHRIASMEEKIERRFDIEDDRQADYDYEIDGK